MTATALYRIANWHTATRRLKSEISGRYATSRNIPTQYFSLHPATAWAEFIRHEFITTPEQLMLVSSRLWVSTVDIADFVEITFANAHEFGILPEQLVSDSYGATQALVDRLLEQSSELLGLITPSAALPGTRNVAFFGQRTDAPYIGPLKGAAGVPSAVAADDSSYLGELLPLVCHFGQPHPGYIAHRNGRPFQFRQPAPLALS
jgi:RES domain-containing protein